MSGVPWTEEQAHFVAEAFYMGLAPEQIRIAYLEQFPETPRTAVGIMNAKYKVAPVMERLAELEAQPTSADSAEALKKEGAKVTFRGIEAEILSSPSERITTLEELFAAAHLNPDEWEVVWVQPNSWEVGAKDLDGNIVVKRLFQIKARLKPVPGIHALQEVKAEILEELRRAPKSPYYANTTAPASSLKGDDLLEMALFDVHLGMLAWAPETGGHYDFSIAVETFTTAVEAILEDSKKYSVEKILFPVGNDFFHTDQTIEGKGGATARGTPQDVDTRWQKSFRIGRQLMNDAVARMLQVAPVEILVVPGNHDTTKTWFLGEVLAAQYEGNPHVRIDNRPQQRKYYSYGNVLLGFTHGHKEKVAELPLIMAKDAREAWGRSRYQEFHLGHRHREFTQEIKGVRLRFLPALSGTDAWHAQMGYVHNVREARGLLWHRERGLRTTLHWVVPPREDDVDLGPAF